MKKFKKPAPFGWAMQLAMGLTLPVTKQPGNLEGVAAHHAIPNGSDKKRARARGGPRVSVCCSRADGR